MRSIFYGDKSLMQAKITIISVHFLLLLGLIFGINAAGNGCFPIKQNQKQVASMDSVEPSLFQEIRSGNLTEQALLNRNDLVTVDKHDNTALHVASQSGQLELVKSLVKDNEFPMDRPNKLGQTALHQAIIGGHNEIVDFLIGAGASLQKGVWVCLDGGFTSSCVDSNKLLLTALQIAIVYGNIEALDKIIAKNPESLRGLVPGVGNILHLAIKHNRFYIIEHLLLKYNDKYKIVSYVIQPNDQGYLPFHYATARGDLESMRTLRKLGANFEMESKNGQHPIHVAVYMQQKESIDLLAAWDADLKIWDGANRDPLTFAKQLQSESGGYNKTINQITNIIQKKESNKYEKPDFGNLPIDNLVFKGGGPKGIAYLGALAALEEKGMLADVERVAGTSAGAITASLLAVGYSPKELRDLLENKSIMDFLDHSDALKFKGAIDDMLKQESPFKEAWGNLKKIYEIYNANRSGWWPHYINFFKDIYAFTGLCPGEDFREWIEGKIYLKTGIQYLTLGELEALVKQDTKKYKRLYMFATRVKGVLEPVLFGTGEKKYQDVIISDLVRASMSIPFVFKTHTLHIKVEGKRIEAAEFGEYVDGGLLRNLPIDIFDTVGYWNAQEREDRSNYPRYNTKTLGFSLSAENAVDTQGRITTALDLVKACVNIYSDAEAMLITRKPENKWRTVEINPQGVGLLSFNLDDNTKKRLINSGKDAVNNFFIKKNDSYYNTKESGSPLVEKEMKDEL